LKTFVLASHFCRLRQGLIFFVPILFEEVLKRFTDLLLDIAIMNRSVACFKVSMSEVRLLSAAPAIRNVN
jgi:hypothetical protein